MGNVRPLYLLHAVRVQAMLGRWLRMLANRGSCVRADQAALVVLVFDAFFRDAKQVRRKRPDA